MEFNDTQHLGSILESRYKEIFFEYDFKKDIVKTTLSNKYTHHIRKIIITHREGWIILRLKYYSHKENLNPEDRIENFKTFKEFCEFIKIIFEMKSIKKNKTPPITLNFEELLEEEYN